MKISGMFTIHVEPATPPPPPQPLTLNPAEGALPDEKVGEPATGEIEISGGVPPYTLTPVAGLPPGVSAELDQTGTKILFTGVPSAAGNAGFVVEVSDSAQ